ncbi:MAG: tetratricopeptide repeat protein [Candidatus Omnitrophota bacterium]|nr:tetratricopeptide repeat protein [Candidatus Omnitrophota bacterium]
MLKKILIFLVFAVLVMLVIHPVDSNDTWMHIKTGGIILENMRIRAVDDYSYTAQGREWLNHQWLSQVIFYIVYRFSGVNGILLFCALFIFLAFLILFRIMYDAKNWLSAVFLITLVIIFSQPEYIARPLVFSLFLFSVFLYILWKYKRSWTGKKENLIYLLIPLQVLWTNLHGASIMGVFLVWAYIAGEFIDTKIRRSGFDDKYVIKGARFNKLFYAGIILTIAAGFTPYGYNLILFPIRESGGMYFIDEWLSPLRNDILLNLDISPYYRLFLIISILIFIFRGRLIAASGIIIFAAFLYLSMSSRRHMPLYGFAVAPYAAYYMKGITIKKIPDYIVKALKQAVSIILALYLLLLCKGIFTGEYYVKTNHDLRFGLGRIEYPDKAIDFLVKTDLKGNMFNDYSSGCYLIWRLYPERRVFIDGRNTVYGVKFIEKDYRKRLLHPGLFEELARKYDINYIFLQHEMANTGALIPYLYHSRQWALVYCDDIACVFLRDTEENRGVIKRYRVDLAKKKDIVRLNKHSWQSVFPARYITRARLYTSVGLSDMAMETLEKAARLMPEVSILHSMLGKLYLDASRYNEASIELKNALRLNPRDINAYNNLGNLYGRLGRHRDARAQFIKALWLDPLNRTARHNLKVATRLIKRAGDL